MDLIHVYTILMFPFLSHLPPATFGLVQPPVAARTDVRPAPPLFTGKTELSFVNTTGNTETTTIGTAASFKLRPGRWLVESDSQFVRTTADEALQAESLGTTLRASRGLNGSGRSVDGYVQSRYLRNTFAGLRHQKAFDVGFSTTVTPQSQRTTQRLRAEVAFGYLSEDRVDSEDKALISGTGGLRYAWSLSKKSEFTQDTYLTLDMSRADDFRVQNAAAISAGLNSFLSLKISHTLTYLNQPVPGFHRTDTIGSAALVAHF
jgi:putative salt-induced outer membrane protein YdiY